MQALVMFVLFPALACAALSGLYVDNGVDRTEMARALTRNERREVEHEILSLLGLSSRPSRAPPGSAAPQFLLDVYKSLLDAPRGDLNLSGRDLNAINESDVIMSFASRSEFFARPLLDLVIGTSCSGHSILFCTNKCW
jgi:bone morphogenetic protein 7